MRDLDELKDTIWANIAKYGCSIIATNDDKYTFTYTIGANPEIIVFGLPPSWAHSFLMSVIEGNYPVDTEVEGLANMPLVLKNVDDTDAAIEDYMCLLKAIDKPPVPIVQLVWPDESGAFPWEPEYAETRQPFLYEQKRIIN